MIIKLDKTGALSVIDSPLEGQEGNLSNLEAFIAPNTGDALVYNGQFWEASGNAYVKAQKVTVSSGSLDKTWQEIHDAIGAGSFVNVFTISADSAELLQIVGAKKESTAYNIYVSGNEDPAYTTDAANKKPAAVE